MILGQKRNRKARCQKGKSCRLTCIQAIKTCLVESGKLISASLGKVRSRILGTRVAPKPGMKRSVKQRYFDVRKKLIARMGRAASDQNRKRYNRYERALKKLDGRFADRFNLDHYDRYKTRSGRYWRDMEGYRHQRRRADRLAVMSKLKQAMNEAALKGNKAQYDKLERSFLKIQDRHLKLRHYGDDEWMGHRTTKGEIWKSKAEERSYRRLVNRLRAVEQIREELKTARDNKDPHRVRQLERGLVKIMDKAQGSRRVRRTRSGVAPSAKPVIEGARRTRRRSSSITPITPTSSVPPTTAPEQSGERRTRRRSSSITPITPTSSVPPTTAPEQSGGRRTRRRSSYITPTSPVPPTTAPEQSAGAPSTPASPAQSAASTTSATSTTSDGRRGRSTRRRGSGTTKTAEGKTTRKRSSARSLSTPSGSGSQATPTTTEDIRKAIIVARQNNDSERENKLTDILIARGELPPLSL